MRIVLLLLLFCGSAHAQILRIDVTAREVTDSAITRIEFDDVQLTGFADNHLTVVFRGLDFNVPLDSLSKIRVKRQTSFWKGTRRGAIIGGTTGILLGGVIGWESAKRSERFESTVVGAGLMGAAFAVVGGAISGIYYTVSGKSWETYNLSRMNREKKIATIQALLSEIGPVEKPQP